jgi:hypothetical protein
MCTATWLTTTDGYELFCNRDESRARLPATPPVILERNDVRFIAPRDGEAGGSWLAVNEHGLSVCLLNHYAADTARAPAPSISRGILLLSFADRRSPDDIARELWNARLDAYRPFLLLILAPRVAPLLLTWNGARVSSDTGPAPPVTTSSFDTAHIIRSRQAMFAGLGRAPDAALLEAYHRSNDPRGGAHSVCMSRDDAHTVSLSHILVSPGLVEFRYRPRASDGGFGDEAAAILPRRS